LLFLEEIILNAGKLGNRKKSWDIFPYIIDLGLFRGIFNAVFGTCKSIYLLHLIEYFTEAIWIKPSAMHEKAAKASIALRDLKMLRFAFSSLVASKAARTG
jgi:hypothetical protein